MKIKTRDLTSRALDWAVAKIEHGTPQFFRGVLVEPTNGLEGNYPPKYRPSNNWTQGGPIIEREKIEWKNHDVIVAGIWYRDGIGADEQRYKMTGDTPLIAAMRTYVASKLGDEIEIPEELCTN